MMSQIFIDYIMNMCDKLHLGITNVGTFFNDPTIIRTHHGVLGDINIFSFRKILKSVLNLTNDTWGYSNPREELRTFTTGNEYPITLVHMCSYWIFSNGEDALRFRLALEEPSTLVKMWPSNCSFNVYEMNRVH